MNINGDHFWEFIENHFDDDTSKLRLKFHGDSEAIKAIEQIELCHKCPEKFVDADGLSLRPQTLHSAVAVEQSTSASIARFHASLVNDCSRVLDMTMGMGIDAQAFASLAGCQVTAIEKDTALFATSLANYSHLANLEVINDDSIEWLRRTDRNFDCVFIDPARRDSLGKRVVNIRDCTPDVIENLDLILAHSPRLIIKLSPMLDVTATLKDLPGTKSLYVVEDRGDCREILVEVERGFDREAEIKVVKGQVAFSFKPSEESAAKAVFGFPSAGQWLYEPWASTMKAGPFKLLCDRFGTAAIAANSHLYFSDSLILDFPGRHYEIVEVLPYQSSVLKRFARQWPEASVAVRNFPLTADKLKAKLRLKESNALRLIATTTADNQKILILSRRIS